jgi:hypothetical protein
MRPTCHPVLFVHAGNKVGKAQTRSPAQHNPAAPGGGRYCCHDAALQLSRLPTLAGGGIRFGLGALVRSGDHPPPRCNVMDNRQAGMRAGGGGGGLGPGPCRLAESRHTHTQHARSTVCMRYKGRPGAVRTDNGRCTVAVQTRACIALGPQTMSLPDMGGEVKMDVRKTPCGERGWVLRLGISCVDRCEKKQVPI